MGPEGYFYHMELSNIRGTAVIYYKDILKILKTP